MDLVQPGPMARSVADLVLVLQVLTAHSDSPDLDAAPGTLADPAAVHLDALRVATYTDDGYFPAAPALRRAVDEAASALRAREVHVERFHPPEVERAVGIFWGLLFADAMVYARRWLGKDRPAWHVRDLLQAANLPSILRPLLARLFTGTRWRMEAQFCRQVRRRTLSLDEFAKLIEEQTDYQRRFFAELDAGRFDAILCPANGLPALMHRCRYGGLANSYTLLFNVLGLPAGVVAATRVRPGEESDRAVGKDRVAQRARAVEEGSAGLPVGVQVAARPWREDVALSLMGVLEEHFRKEADYPAHPPR
jgi:fatty acid amide hydrolase